MEGWLRLASHLRMSLQRCMEETPSTHFLLWMAYLQEEPNHFHREDYYFAQIAREIRAVLHKNPGSLKIDNFLMRFEPSKKEHRPDYVMDEPVEEIPTPEEMQRRTNNSKAFWLNLAGLKDKAKKYVSPKPGNAGR